MFEPSNPSVGLVTTDRTTIERRRRGGAGYCCNTRRLLAEERSLTDIPTQLTDIPTDRLLAELATDGHPGPHHTGTHHTAHGANALPDDVAGLVGHLVDHHHTFLRRELPRLNEIMTRMVAAHSHEHPELHGIAATVAALTDELLPHIDGEERELFPLVQQLLDDGDTAPASDGRGVRDKVKVVHAAHDRISELLTMLRAQTCNFTPPRGACLAWRALYAGLADFETSTQQHVHLEDTALFPRLLEFDAGVVMSS